MKILLATSEAAPFIKTGGLGDVAAALPKALAESPNTEVYVFLPYYKAIKDNPEFDIEYITNFSVPLSWRNVYCGLFRAVSKKKKLQYYFIDNEYYFYRDGCYGHYDDGERFAFYSKAILESLEYLDWYPDVIHANDWQTALVPVFLRAFYMGLEKYQPIRTLFTIHNMEYQGRFPDEFVDEVLGLPEDWKATMHFDTCTNLMKAAIHTADRVSTVSRTYSFEIQDPYYAHGLHDVLRQHAYKLSGVVNGIDTEVFDPATDPLLYANFDSATLEKKAENKKFLQQRLGLAVRDVPMIVMITRLVGHKGVDLVQAVMDDLMWDDRQLVIIGTGERQYENMFRAYAANFPAKMSANIVFDNTLAHQAYAGADLVLMPSKQEPCGLTQLIAMRYGTIPIVRETGGLFDTVPAYNIETGEGNGFTFKSYNAHDMLDAVRRAEGLFFDKDHWTALQKSVMNYDSSWKRSVQEYWDIYRSIAAVNN
ncbi:MAG: glycogen synthase GlgA [Oscillospiraceae bacterium]|nr:glycogen synthase GlgA [Oscillospiraceae bacterium]MCI8808145.1 glycogen synthase GlgA [Oscillospiraceae bacterium]MCI9548439.1 glycogen synthase GlgA [Oscillospiraceae bacterium]